MKDKSSDNSFGYFFEKTPVSVDTQNISFPNSNGVFDVPMINEQNINSTNSNTPISKQPSNVNNTVSNVKKKVPNAKNINSTNSNGAFSVPIINEQNKVISILEMKNNREKANDSIFDEII